MRVLDFIASLGHAVPWSRERAGKPTRSEIRRWLDSGSVIMNGEKAKTHDEVSFPVNSLVFFPSSAKGRVTLA
jgi:hypothetical protein